MRSEITDHDPTASGNRTHPSLKMRAIKIGCLILTAGLCAAVLLVFHPANALACLLISGFIVCLIDGITELVLFLKNIALRSARKMIQGSDAFEKK